MKYWFGLLTGCCMLLVSNAQSQVTLKQGMTIRTSVLIKKGQYTLPAPATPQQAVIVISGKNITVDFNGAELSSLLDPTQPDAFSGVAILVQKGSANITIKNAVARGYKIALLADSVTGLVVQHCDFSYNYRQRLKSNRVREDISDWMSYHHNEAGEWLRYGAGIYLDNCNKALIVENTITNGQCGLMLNRCTNIEVVDNDFCFNSAIGIGLYRSSHNRFYHNRLDFNVRGFSFGHYYRGQDSAGFLVFEQCSNNVFAYNTATHSGDGFFLWAGQQTMDSGEGGCNDNLLYGNDFSYAPTNGVEVTFSRNTIVHNTIRGCDHGIWGGYSYATDIAGNNFSDNRIAIAIEHGQYNSVVNNGFSNDRTAIKLWSRKTQPADWVYAQQRDTRSTGYTIAGNSFNGHTTVFDLAGSDSLLISNNRFAANTNLYKTGERMGLVDSTSTPVITIDTAAINRRLATIPYNTLPHSRFPRGREQMRITGWGPYNFRYPLLWLKQTDSNGIYTFEVLGPEGTWAVGTVKGFTLYGKVAGTFPATFQAKVDSSVQDRFIRLNYTGAAFTDMFGRKQAAGKPQSFRYTEFDPKAKWDVSFYSWNAGNHPVHNAVGFIRQLNNPVYTTTTSAIDYTWWGNIGSNLPADSFATVATAVIELPAGRYSIGLTADDLARLYIDDKPVIDAWDPGFVQLDENTHHRVMLQLGGRHRFRVEHADIGGLATLMLYIQPVHKE